MSVIPSDAREHASNLHDSLSCFVDDPFEFSSDPCFEHLEAMGAEWWQVESIAFEYGYFRGIADTLNRDTTEVFKEAMGSQS